MEPLSCLDPRLNRRLWILKWSRVGRGLVLTALMLTSLLAVPPGSTASTDMRADNTWRAIHVAVWAPGGVPDPYDSFSDWALEVFKQTDSGSWEILDSWLLGSYLTSPDGARRLTVSSATDPIERVMRPLPVGTYRLRIVDGRGVYTSTYYPNSPSLEGATDIVVSDANSTPSISMSFPAHVGTFYGRVTTWSGVAQWLKLYRRDANGVWQHQIAYGEGTTMPDGSFRLGALAPGVYRVGYENGDSCGQLQDVYWPSSPTLKGAGNIEISAGSVVRGVNLVIPRQNPGVTLTGKPRVGQTLVASIRSVGAVRTRWYVGTQLVRKPPSATYLRLRRWMKGERIKVVVTGMTCTDTERYRTTVKARSREVR
jgi:hypothetical protein